MDFCMSDGAIYGWTVCKTRRIMLIYVLTTLFKAGKQAKVLFRICFYTIVAPRSCRIFNCSEDICPWLSSPLYIIYEILLIKCVSV